MSDGNGVEAVRLLVVNGKPEIRAEPIEDSRPGGTTPNWGSLYAVCHVPENDSSARLLCDRIEEIAHETYARAPGGITNRLRQTLRNANRYLYLRNRARGERRRVVASLGCLAIRGSDAYGCGAGPHTILILNSGLVRRFVSAPQASASESKESWQGNGHVLGWYPTLPDPTFCYRQVFPRDLILMVAGDDRGVFDYAADEVGAIAQEQQITKAAQQIAGLLAGSSSVSGLLVRIGSEAEAPPKALFEMVGDTEARYEPARTSAPRAQPAWRTKKGLPARERKAVLRHRILQRGRSDVGSATESHATRRGVAPASLTQSPQSAKQALAMFGLVGTLLVSLICGLWTRSRAVLGSSARLVKRTWGWTRREHVFGRLARGCELAFLSVWAGSKGLLVRILPERQGRATAYHASARVMARPRIVGFNPSRSARVAAGALIMLAVLAAVAASAVRVKARLEQGDVDSLLSQSEDLMRLAQQEESPQAQVDLLLQAQETIERAAAIRGPSADVSEMLQQLAGLWDSATGSVRITLQMEQMPDVDEGPPSRIVVHRDQLYLVDGSGKRIQRYVLDEEGKTVANQQPWTWELETTGDTQSEERILDVEWVEAGSGRATPALLILTTEGSLLELNAAGVVREVVVSNPEEWQRPLAIQTYAGNLYVLDQGQQTIMKYLPTGDDYQQAPLSYLQAPADVPWSKVVDMAIDGFVYLLCSDGSILKFAGGVPESFTQAAVYPQLQQPLAIFASEDSASVLVVDPGQGRIVQFATDGQLMRQLLAAVETEDALKDLRSFTVDPLHERVYVGTTAGLFSGPLPETP